MATQETPAQVPVYNVNDGLVGRNGGPYLDEELAKRAEELNARREDRKPNYDPKHLKTVSHPGINLVTGDQLLKVSADAGSVALSENGGKITAPEYGKIDNPVKADQEKQAARTETAAKRAANKNNADKKAEDK